MLEVVLKVERRRLSSSEGLGNRLTVGDKGGGTTHMGPRLLPVERGGYWCHLLR